jgi:hypothetical protein
MARVTSRTPVTCSGAALPSLANDAINMADTDPHPAKRYSPDAVADTKDIPSPLAVAQRVRTRTNHFRRSIPGFATARTLQIPK